MSTHIIGFYEDLTKIIFQLSSNTHLISSSALDVDCRDRNSPNKITYTKVHVSSNF